LFVCCYLLDHSQVIERFSAGNLKKDFSSGNVVNVIVSVSVICCNFTGLSVLSF
jgi:hypothetical protein